MNFINTQYEVTFGNVIQLESPGNSLNKNVSTVDWILECLCIQNCLTLAEVETPDQLWQTAFFWQRAGMCLSGESGHCKYALINLSSSIQMQCEYLFEIPALTCP